MRPSETEQGVYGRAAGKGRVVEIPKNKLTELPPIVASRVSVLESADFVLWEAELAASRTHHVELDKAPFEASSHIGPKEAFEEIVNASLSDVEEDSRIIAGQENAQDFAQSTADLWQQVGAQL